MRRSRIHHFRVSVLPKEADSNYNEKDEPVVSFHQQIQGSKQSPLLNEGEQSYLFGVSCFSIGSSWQQIVDTLHLIRKGDLQCYCKGSYHWLLLMLCIGACLVK